MELRNRDQIEAKFGRRLGKLSRRHAAELEKLLGNPPDVTRVPSAFWVRVEQEQREELAAILLLIFIAAASQHGLGNATQQGQAWASGRAQQVASGFVSHSRERLEAHGQEWRQEEPKTAQVRERIKQLFGPSRIESLVVSETTAAASEGGETAIRDTVGVSEGDTWFTVRDSKVCPICEPLHRAERSRWSRFFPGGPPAHPNCRCFIEYANEREGALVTA